VPPIWRAASTYIVYFVAVGRPSLPAQGTFSATTVLDAILGTGAAGLIASALTIPSLFAAAGAVGVVAAIVVADALPVPVAVDPPDAAPPAPVKEVQTSAIS